MKLFSRLPLLCALLSSPALLAATPNYDETKVAPGTHIPAIRPTYKDFTLEIPWVGKVSGVYYQEIQYFICSEPADFPSRIPCLQREGIRTKVTNGTFTQHVIIPHEHLQERNYFFIERRSYHAGSSEISEAQFYYGLEFDMLTPTTFLLKEGTITPRDHPTSTIINGTTNHAKKPYTIVSSSLPNEEVNPVDGKFPLGQARFHQTTPAGLAQPLLSGQGYLIIKSGAEDFLAGEKLYFEDRSSVRFPIALQRNGTRRNSLIVSTGNYAVSRDGRRFVNYADREPEDLITKDIYFPPVKTGETKRYECVFLFPKSGEAEVDTLRYDFRIWRTRNEFGSCSSSAYCLEEVS